LNGVFGDGVPAVVNGELGGAAYGFGDAAGLAVVGISDDRAGRPYRGLDEAVFAVPDQGAVRVHVGREGAAGHVAIRVERGVIRYGVIRYLGILVERVGGVGGGGGIIRINTACCGTQPVADHVEGVGAV